MTVGLHTAWDGRSLHDALFGWRGRARDGCIVVGGKRASILRMVKPAPRLAAALTKEAVDA